MWLDVIDLRDFYDSGPGQVARRLIRRRLREAWPDVRGLRVLGVGFATPYLRPFRDEAERVAAVMPAGQGVLPWPAEGPGLVALAEDDSLPFPDRSFDRIVLVHAIEHSEHVRGLLREVWRVLTDSGRLIVVAPNRQGLWARLESTPFASGHPYSAPQLQRLLRDTLFTPLGTSRALYMPPARSRLMLSWAGAWEDLGARWFTQFAGVVMVEACKQIYALPPGVRERDKARRYLPLPEGFGLPGRSKGAGSLGASPLARRRQKCHLKEAGAGAPMDSHMIFKEK